VEQAPFLSLILVEGGIGVCGVAVLGNFYCGVAVKKQQHCGVAVIVNPAGCGVCVSKPTVFGEAIYYL